MRHVCEHGPMHTQGVGKPGAGGLLGCEIRSEFHRVAGRMVSRSSNMPGIDSGGIARWRCCRNEAKPIAPVMDLQLALDQGRPIGWSDSIVQTNHEDGVHLCPLRSGKRNAKA